MRLQTAVVAAATLLVGFAVATLTGNRALGGVVVVVGAVWCLWRWWGYAGPARAVAAVLVGGVAFVVSHPLGKVIGAWPAVLLVSAVGALVAYALTPPRRAAVVAG